MKVLIVDDESPARRKIRSFLHGMPGSAEVLVAENGEEAVRKILEAKPDLVFLDIQMPGLSGLDVIRIVGVQAMPAVVFTTAFDKYAVAAFDLQAVDYLLKPFDAGRFARALQRAQARIDSCLERRDTLDKLLKLLAPKPEPLTRILVKSGERYSFVAARDLLYVSAEEKYVRLHTAQSRHLVRGTMAEMERNLDPTQFVRIHRYYIINREAISEIQPWSHGDGLVILTTGEKLPLSRRFRNRLIPQPHGGRT